MIVGVAGEVVCDWNNKKEFKERLKKFFGIVLVSGLIWEISEALKADKKIAGLQVQAGEANKQAKVAEQKAGEANERAEKFEKQAAELFSIGERAKESAAKATAESEKAKEEREKAESGRLELEKQVLTLIAKTHVRMVNKQARDDLAAFLAEKPTGKIDIVMFDKDPESIAFGLSIKKALIDAGCSNVAFSPRGIFNIDQFPGVIESHIDLVLCAKSAKTGTAPLYAMKIMEGLTNSGIKAGWGVNDDLDPVALQIIVCPKASVGDE